MCCPKASASSVTGAPIGDTGEMVDHHQLHHGAIRNDMDVVGVRAGCTFTGFSGSAFNGNSVMVRAELWDHWVVFSR